MPEQDTTYRARTYSALKSELGNSFAKTEAEFYSALDNEQGYQQRVYTALKGELGDSFQKSEDEFYSLIKKKDEASQISSEDPSQSQLAGAEPPSGFRTVAQKGQQIGRPKGEVDTFGDKNSPIADIPSSITGEYQDAPWADLSGGERSVFENVEQHYKDKGWPSPYEKIASYEEAEAVLMADYEAGKIGPEEYTSGIVQAAEEMGLNLSEDGIDVSDKELTMYNDLVDRYYRQGLNKRKASESDGFAKDVLDALNVGSARVLGLPTRVMALSENVSGKLLNVMGLQDEGSPTYFQEKADIEKEVVESWAEANNRYDSSIGEALATGDMKTAVGQAILSTAETLPQLTMLILGNAAGVTNATLGYMGADKAIDKYLQNEKNPDMKELTKITNALGVGLSEVVFESMGTVSIINSTRRAIRKIGEEKVRDAILRSYTPFLQNKLAILDKGVSAATREGGSEGATQLTDNIMDKASGLDVDIGDGVGDAMIIGSFIGWGLATPQMVKSHGGMSEYVKRIRSVVPEDLNFDQKIELIDLLVKGDEINHKIVNGPEASKDALKAEMEEVKAKANRIRDPEYQKQLDLTKDLSKAGDTLAKGKKKAETPVDTSNKPIEPLSTQSEGKVPLEGESAEKPLKTPPVESGEIETRDAGKLDVEVKSRDEDGGEAFRLTATDKDGKKVAMVDVGKEGDAHYILQAETAKDQRRKGVMTSMYDYIEKGLGKKLEQTKFSEQTEEGTAFVESRKTEEGGGRVSLEDISAKHKDVTIDVSENKKTGTLTLNRIIVPEGKRGEGMGSSAMKDIVKYADESNLKIILTPSKDFGATSIPRLKKFYKQFGFVENKGANRDFSHKDDMYRNPVVESKTQEDAIQKDKPKEAIDKEGATKEGIPKAEEVKEEPPIAMEVEYDSGKKPPEPPEGEGIPLPEPEAEKTPMQKLKDRDAARDEEIKKRTPSFKARMRTFLDEQILDVNKKAKDKILKLGKDAPDAARRLVNRIITQKGATGQSKVDLMDASAAVFGEGLKTMSEKEQKLLGDILSLRRTVEIDESVERKADETNELFEMLHEGGMTKEDAQANLDKIMAKDPEMLEYYGLKNYDVAALEKSLTEYYRVMQEQLQKQFDNGLINEALYTKLKEEYPHYSPRMVMKYMEEMDPDGSISGIKPLEGGSTEAAMIDPFTLMAHTIQRTNALIARNRTVKEAAKFAEAAPNDMIKNAPYSEAFAEKVEAKEEGDKFIEPEFEEAPHNMEAIDYAEDGQRKQVWIDKDIWKYMEYESPGEKVAGALTGISWLTGTPILKMAATGVNPEFAVKNLPIDALHAWMTTGIYSTFMPKAMNQLRNDYAKVANDAWNKEGRYKEYAEEGGLMDFLTTQGRTPMKYGKHTKTTSSVRQLGDSLAKLGEFSEVWTRLALRERAIENAKKSLGREPTPEELTEIKRDATAQARDYLDFSQGGNATKVVDKFIPYLNAGVQVTRGSLRAAANNPKDFGMKLAQITGLATTLVAWNMGHNPGGDDEEKKARRNAYMNDVSPGVKARNFVLMTNVKYRDKANNERYMYFKIPKDALQSSITALMEDMFIRHVSGEKVKIMDEKMFSAMKNELRNITDLGNLPPFVRGAAGSDANYDKFYDREIWMGSDQPDGKGEEPRDRSREFYPGITPERFVRFGELTGLSPVRTQYFTKQVLTESNVYLSMLGEILDGWSTGMEKNAKGLFETDLAYKVANFPFMRRIAKSTYPQSGGNYEAWQQQYNKMTTTNNQELDIFFQETEDAINDDGFNTFLENIAEDFGQYEAERMMDRATQKMMKDGVSISMIKLKRLSPEVRARAFHELLKENPEQEDRLFEEAEQLKINSERFNTEVGRLIDEEPTQE